MQTAEIAGLLGLAQPDEHLGLVAAGAGGPLQVDGQFAGILGRYWRLGLSVQF